MALSNAQKQKRWRDKRNALVKEAERLRAALPLDESTLVSNLLRLSEGNDAVALRATMFLLTHKVWVDPPKPPEIGKKERLQRAAEDALDGDEHQEWSDLLLQ